MSSVLEPPSFARAVANGAVIGLGRACFLVIRALFIFLLVPLLGIDAYGEYVLAQSWYLLVMPLAMWGVSELSIRGYLRRPPEERAAFLGTALALRILMGGVATLLITVTAATLETVPELRLLIYVYATGTLSRGISNWLGAVFTALGASASWLRISITFATLEAVLVLVAASLGVELRVLAFMQASIWVLSALVGYIYYAARFGAVRLAWHSEFARHFLKDGASVGGAAFLLLSIVPGLLLLYRYLDPDLAGFGALALVLQVLLLAQQMVMVIMNAMLASLGGDKGLGAAGTRVFLEGGLRVAVFAGGAIALCVLVVAESVASAFSASVFSPALELLASYSWIVVPILLVQCFRLVVIAKAAFPVYLLGVLAGAIVAPASLVLVSVFASASVPSVLMAMGLGLTLMALILGGYCFFALSLAEVSLRRVLVAAVPISILFGCYFFQPGPVLLLALTIAFAVRAWLDSVALLSDMRVLQPSQSG